MCYKNVITNCSNYTRIYDLQSRDNLVYQTWQICSKMFIQRKELHDFHMKNINIRWINICMNEFCWHDVITRLIHKNKHDNGNYYRQAAVYSSLIHSKQIVNRILKMPFEIVLIFCLRIFWVPCGSDLSVSFIAQRLFQLSHCMKIMDQARKSFFFTAELRTISAVKKWFSSFELEIV